MTPVLGNLLPHYISKLNELIEFHLESTNDAIEAKNYALGLLNKARPPPRHSLLLTARPPKPPKS